MRQGESDFGGKQDAESEIVMVQACDEEVHGCLVRKRVRLTMDDFFGIEVGRRNIEGM